MTYKIKATGSNQVAIKNYSQQNYTFNHLQRKGNFLDYRTILNNANGYQYTYLTSF